jgi:hypothetical protein
MSTGGEGVESNEGEQMEQMEPAMDSAESEALALRARLVRRFGLVS